MNCQGQTCRRRVGLYQGGVLSGVYDGGESTRQRLSMGRDSVPAKEACENLGEGLRAIEKEVGKWLLPSGLDN